MTKAKMKIKAKKANSSSENAILSKERWQMTDSTEFTGLYLLLLSSDRRWAANIESDEYPHLILAETQDE